MSLLQMYTPNNMAGHTWESEPVLDTRCFETVLRTDGVQGVLNMETCSM